MRQSIALTVNGSRIERDVEPRTLLVHFLREELGSDGHAHRLRHLLVRRLHACTSTARP